MSEVRTGGMAPGLARYHRAVAVVTGSQIPHREEREAEVRSNPIWRRGAARRELEARLGVLEAAAAAGAQQLVREHQEVIAELDAALARLHDLGRTRIAGKVADDRARLARARVLLGEVEGALRGRDFEAAGREMMAVDKELWGLGGQALPLALNAELEKAAYSRDLKQRMAANQVARREVRLAAERARKTLDPAVLRACLSAYRPMAESYTLIAEALGRHVAKPERTAARVGAENQLQVVQPQDLPRMDEVGGLEAAKETLRRTVGLRLESPDAAARYGVASNGVLLYGPPGTGKSLLARALAGQHGLRYLRVSPAVIASPFAHETARNLARVFELARESAPCLLFLDEIDALASARTGLPTAEHREVVTQLLTLLEDHRDVHGLVIVAATNALDLLDTALREGRFDTRIAVPLPDEAARREILEVHLRGRDGIVDWDLLDLDEVARRTSGRSGAALEQLVGSAAERAMGEGARLGQEQLLAAAAERTGRDRVRLETSITWDDVVIPETLARRLRQLLLVIQRPEMAQGLGIQIPAGVLLWGPPGSGKTTIAKAMASEAGASFYEASAAEILSKWVGESEERVAKLFAKARENRPSIVFIDEIEGLLRRRSSSSSSPWEGRVVGQFLTELDGLRSGPGVFLVGATNRIDIIDEAIVERRLTSLEVPLPDLSGRRRLLERRFPETRRGADVDLDRLAEMTEGMSGADLDHLRDAAGLRTLERIGPDGTSGEVRVTLQDILESLGERRLPLTAE